MGRLLIRVSGVVQGVGFRPFVSNLAMRYGLSGFVRNEGDGIRIEVEGEQGAIEHFRTALTESPPAGARIAEVATEELPEVRDGVFMVKVSQEPTGTLCFAPTDVATCSDCLKELFDPTNRRFRYPFISCARCGPRFTVIESLPYDRERTTMAGFPLCPACQQEYEDPTDRRFHAQTTACPACGPRLELLDAHGQSLAEPDPLAAAVSALLRGEIVAVKGLGGFHLACGARRGNVIAKLRRRKHRDEKPLAVMVANLDAASALCELTHEEAALLASDARPIVLSKRRAGAPVADEVAPHTPLLGVMLAYTPLHHLLLHDFGGALVMTSGNQSDEPIAADDTDAIRRLSGIADQFLTHNRPIRSRCDDSVTRVVAGAPLPVRRSRGHVPLTIPLPFRCDQPILALGGQLKSVFALGHGNRATLSHHHGDLDNYDAFRAFTEAVTDYQRLFRIQPEVIAHDLHPEYSSTRHAIELAAGSGARLVAVQHHHAHMAACMAENGLNEPVIGVTFDGAGYGPDGTLWGGEFLVGDYRSFRRAAHLRPVPLPGGDAAAREPWRVALSHLLDAAESPQLLADRIEPIAWRTVATMIERRLNSPHTSSAGRLFDAVAAIIGLRDAVTYEGQAATELEGLASGTTPSEGYPFTLTPTRGEPLQVDTRPIIAAVVADVRAGVPRDIIASRFHTTLADVIAAVCWTLRDETGLNAVVLSGGVFLNAILLAESLDRLTRDGFRVFRHSQVPPGDGGLCLGQLVVAASLATCDNPLVPYH